MHKILIDPSRERQILDFRLFGFQDVLVLGRYLYREARSPLQMHDHGQLLEICYLAEGRQFYRVNEEDYFLNGGDVLINYPQESHGTGFLREGKGRLYWLILQPPSAKSEYLGMSSGNGKILYEKLFQFPSRHFKLKIGGQKDLESVFAAFEKETAVPSDKASGKNPPLFLINVRNHLLRFLLDLIEAAQEQPRNETSSGIVRAVHRIKSEEATFHTMKQLARESGLSESRFKHRFKEEIGTTPADYQVRYKVDCACQMLLRTDQTILDTALSLGFSSSQYFATVFRRYMGMSPAEYRNMMRGGNS
ncbi:MAG: AraC family transcriptional regulator [Planctomycetaceae bacterium]|jgi:AraC-like DNA-binding protein|nr:AraC family transcriptional regulator [Planctomycetaceae bacterium]